MNLLVRDISGPMFGCNISTVKVEPKNVYMKEDYEQIKYLMKNYIYCKSLFGWNILEPLIEVANNEAIPTNYNIPYLSVKNA